MSETTATTDQSDPTTPVPVPPGTTTAGTVKQIKVRRKMPDLLAACYDGTNAVQVAGWLLGQGQPCNLVMVPGKPPVLTNAGGVPVAQGWVLPNLEVIAEQELGTTYEKIVDPAAGTPIP